MDEESKSLGIGSGWIAPAAGLAGGLISMIGAKKRAERQFMQQKELMGLQRYNQGYLNQQGFDLQKRMWEETNYPEQMKQLAIAGLNPSLLYGKGGAGGATTGSQGGGSASGGAAPQAPSAPMDIQTGLAMAKAMSEINLLKAQAKELDTRAEKQSGVDTDEGKARIQSLLQGVENQKAQEALIRVNTRIQEVQLYVDDESKEDKIDRIMYETEKAVHDVDIARSEAWVNTRAQEARLEIVRSNMSKAALEVELTKAHLGKTREETKKIANDILVSIGMLEVSGLQAASASVQAGAAADNAATRKGELAMRGQELNFEMVKTQLITKLQEIGLSIQQQRVITDVLGDIFTMTKPKYQYNYDGPGPKK